MAGRRVRDLGGSVGHVLAGAECRAQLEDAVAVGLASEAGWQQALGLGPVASELAVGGRANTHRRAELPLDARRDPHQRCDSGIRPALAEQRALELCVGAVERLVVPVEAAARLRDAEQEIDEHGPEERIVLRGVTSSVRARVDRRRRLAAELLEGDQGVLAAAQPGSAGLDEVPDEGPVLVERRPIPRLVLLEREREGFARLVELPQQVSECAERERAEGVMELR